MVDSGIDEILIVISKDKKAIERYFSRDKKLEKHLIKTGKFERLAPLVDLLNKVKIKYAYQNEPLGNGHALLFAKNFCGSESFVCSDADSIIASEIPAIKQILEVFEKYHATVMGVQKIINKKDMTRYGNVFGDWVENSVYRATKFVEKPSLENVSPQGLIVGGMRYVLTPEIWPALKKQQKGKDNEIWLVDAVNALAQNGDVFACEYEGKYLDTGRVESWIETNEYFLKNKKV
jgi:UTP--glucose-1-phosphate uridylyltransferase